MQCKGVGQAIRKEIQEATPMFSSCSPDPNEIKYEREKIPELLEASFKNNPAI